MTVSAVASPSAVMQEGWITVTDTMTMGGWACPLQRIYGVGEALAIQLVVVAIVPRGGDTVVPWHYHFLHRAGALAVGFSMATRQG